MPKHSPVSQTDVLKWLHENHPRLHSVAELERDWVWLVVDLRGDHNKPTRESIKAFGFRFHFRGGHALPSGKVGTWAHSCMKPMGFHKGKHKRNNSDDSSPISDDELLQLIEQQI